MRYEGGHQQSMQRARRPDGWYAFAPNDEVRCPQPVDGKPGFVCAGLLRILGPGTAAFVRPFHGWSPALPLVSTSGKIRCHKCERWTEEQHVDVPDAVSDVQAAQLPDAAAA